MDAGWVTQQKRTFTKWVNKRLRKIQAEPVADLQTGFDTGVALLDLVRAVYDQTPPTRVLAKPRNVFERTENINAAFKILESLGVNISLLKPTHLLEHDLKMVLGMVWAIILHSQINSAGGGTGTGGSAKEGLLQWCRDMTGDLVRVDNFTTSWVDGLAFLAVLHTKDPVNVDMSTRTKDMKEENLSLAFDIAETKYGVARLLDVEDFLGSLPPDEQSVMTYISELYQTLGPAKKDPTPTPTPQPVPPPPVVQQAVPQTVGHLATQTELGRVEIDAQEADYKKNFETLRKELEEKEVKLQESSAALLQSQKKMAESVQAFQSKVLESEEERKRFEERIAQLKVDIEEKQGIIASNAVAAAERQVKEAEQSAALAKLREEKDADVKKLEDRILEVMRVSDEKDRALLDTAQKSMTDHAKISEISAMFQKQIAERDAELSKSHEKERALQRTMEEQQRLIAQQNDSLEEARNRETEHSKIQQALSQNEEEMRVLKARLEQMQAAKDKASVEQVETGKDVSLLNEKIKERDDRITALQRALAEKEETSRQQVALITQLQQSTDLSHHGLLAEKEDQLRKLAREGKEALELSDRDLTQLRLQLDERDRSIEQLQKRQRQLEDMLASKNQQQNEAAAGQLEHWQIVAKALSDATHRSCQGLDELLQAIATLASQANRQSAGDSALKEELTRKESELVQSAEQVRLLRSRLDVEIARTANEVAILSSDVAVDKEMAQAELKKLVGEADTLGSELYKREQQLSADRDALLDKLVRIRALKARTLGKHERSTQTEHRSLVASTEDYDSDREPVQPPRPDIVPESHPMAPVPINAGGMSHSSTLLSATAAAPQPSSIPRPVHSRTRSASGASTPMHSRARSAMTASPVVSPRPPSDTPSRAAPKKVVVQATKHREIPPLDSKLPYHFDSFHGRASDPRDQKTRRWWDENIPAGEGDSSARVVTHETVLALMQERGYRTLTKQQARHIVTLMSPDKDSRVSWEKFHDILHEYMDTHAPPPPATPPGSRTKHATP